MIRYLIIFMLSTLLFLGSKYPENPFTPPVDRLMELSGTYGELRPRHFHSGIDIKSKNGQSGEAIFASANGFISRIRVSAVGYGNVVYIDHPNGYTTVYAHLDEFAPELKAFVDLYQARHHTFEIDIRPAEDLLAVCGGEMIGRMGNSGSSLGVHLHYEIRHTESETPIDPLNWPWNYKDDAAPYIQELYIYQLDPEHYCINKKKLKAWGPGAKRSVRSGPIRVSESTIALGLRTYDPFNRWMNRNGISTIEIALEGEGKFSMILDSIPFHYRDQFNLHIDYDTYCERKQFVHQLFRSPENNLPIYHPAGQKGTYQVRHNDSLDFVITVSDRSEKKSKLFLSIIGDSTLNTTTLPNPKSIEREEICLEKEEGWLAAISIEDYCSPITKEETLRFDLENIPENLYSKVYIAEISGPKKKDMGGQIENYQISTQMKQAGVFALEVDSIAPRFHLLAQRLRPGGKIIGRIQNELFSRYRHRDVQYDVSLNGAYVPHTYDKKYRKLSIQIPDDWNETDTIKLELRDRLNNRRVYSFN